MALSATTLSEADTRAKLIDPKIHARGWTEELIRREETAGAVEIVDGRPRRLRVPRVPAPLLLIELQSLDLSLTQPM